MNIYDWLLKLLSEKYENVKVLKMSERSEVSVIRHKESGKWYVLRKFEGDSVIYQQLLTVSCTYLPKIFEVGEKKGRTVVLEEYIHGDTLDCLLDGQLLTVADAKKIMKQLCKALWVLHSKGVVHRDIKPENVMMRGDEAVLLDFDAARIYKDKNLKDTQILGTIGFAAPEQFGVSQSDERADIYALGVLLNVMLTGQHPSKVLAAGKMGNIVQKCTMVNPKKRYRNVLYLMEAL